MRAFLTTLALLSATATVAAQVKPLTKSLPRAFAGWDAPESNWLPLGRRRSLLQTWYHGSGLRKGAVNEIGWRIDKDSVAPKTNHQIEIILSDTTKTFSTVEPTFAKNLGAAPVVFLKTTNIDFPAVSRPQNPDQPSLWIKGERPFMFKGPHLIVQVRVTTELFRNVELYQADSYFQENGSIHGATGKGCGKGTLSASVDRGLWTLDLAGITPQMPGIFLIGFDHVAIGGSLPLPLDLTPLGMKGCTLNVDTLLIRVRVADATGTVRFQLPVPKAGTDPVVVHAQCFELDKSKTAGLASSNAVHSILSDKGLSTYLYNWDRDQTVAQYGPFPINAGAVLLWK